MSGAIHRALLVALCCVAAAPTVEADDGPDVGPLLAAVERIGATCSTDPADVTARIGDAAVFVSCSDAATVNLVGTISLDTCGAIASALFGASVGEAFVASGGAPARSDKGEIIRTFGLCEATVRIGAGEAG